MTEATTITEYSATEAALAELRQQYQGIVFDVATTKGDKEARAARQELVKLRTSLEAKRKEIKAPALAYASAIDSEARRITAEIRALEEPIDQQIKQEEERKAAEKAERERIEQERVSAIKRKIDALRNLPVDSTADSSAELAATLADLKEYQITEAEFAEFKQEADDLCSNVVETLERMHAAALAREEEAERQAAERAELERLRRKQEEREAAERAEREEEARKLAAEREAIARERAELEALRKQQEQAAQPEPEPEPEPVPVHQQEREEPVQAAAPEPAEEKIKTLRLGQINELLHPISISADGLAELGFHPVATERASKLYRESEMAAICHRIELHVSAVQDSLS